MKNFIAKFTLLIIGVLVFGAANLSADINRDAKKDKDAPLRNYSEFRDLQENTVSNIAFWTSNYGIFGLNVKQSVGGGYWPRGSQNQYIFGGGVWFGARKRRPAPNDTSWRKYVLVTYNPNSGLSWMVPGRIEDGEEGLENDIKSYRTYFSTDFNKQTGEPFNPSEGPNWPVWDASDNPEDTLKKNRYFGRFIYDPDEEKRNLQTYPKGPAFISGEDIFATYKDTDLNYYEGGYGRRKAEGYPLRLQFEQTIYSWGFGDYKDFIFIRYDIINYSPDTLLDCYLAPIMDIDVATQARSRPGAANDRVKFYDTDTTLNLAFQWTNPDEGEGGKGFGYLGFDFLESPATIKAWSDWDYITDPDTGEIIDSTRYEVITDSTGFVRKDSAFYANSSQLGLVTFRNWSIDDDILEDEPRYNYISSRIREGDTGPGDKRFLMATGPFHMRPAIDNVPVDTVRVIVGLICANPAVAIDANGTEQDVAELIRKDKFAQKVYDENFRAPTPPEPSFFVKPETFVSMPGADNDNSKFQPLNNGIVVSWNEGSEMTNDTYESGMDFLGYKLYRARRSDLDTFAVSNIAADKDYPSGRGPFGWKQIAQYSIPTPFIKSSRKAGGFDDDPAMPYIDSLWLLGPAFKKDVTSEIDTFAIQVARIGSGMFILDTVSTFQYNYDNHPIYYNGQRLGHMTPAIIDIDTTYKKYNPWPKFYRDNINYDFKYPPNDLNRVVSYKYYDKPNYVMDSILIGTIYLNRALLSFNPLYFWTDTRNVNPDYLKIIPEDGIIKTIDTIEIAPGVENYHETVDTVYHLNTLRSANVNGQEVHVIDLSYRIPPELALYNYKRVFQVLDSVYKYIQQGKASVEFPDFESSEVAKEQIIKPFMKQTTNNRTFTDVGDDNRDGRLLYNEDPTITEKILNNIPYFYKILAYDEGDYSQPTPSKINSASPSSPNFVEANAAPSSANKDAGFEVIYVDSSKIGGLYNFNFFPIDQERVNQLFAGDTLELTFEPFPQLYGITIRKDTITSKQFEIGYYYSKMTLENLSKKDTLYSGIFYYEVTPCRRSYARSFCENAAAYYWSYYPQTDSVTGEVETCGMRGGIGRNLRKGSFTTGNMTQEYYCYANNMQQPAYGAFGFSFDFAIEQWCGAFRPDTTCLTWYDTTGAGSYYRGGVIKGDATTPINFLGGAESTQNVHEILTTFQPRYEYELPWARWIEGFPYYDFDLGGMPIYKTMNNGPSRLKVVFQPGGVETMTLKWGGSRVSNADDSATFQVPYLTVTVENTLTYNRPTEFSDFDSVEVSYPGSYEHKELPIYAETGYPSPKALGINADEFVTKYNIHSFAYANGRESYTNRDTREQWARPTEGDPRSMMDEATVGTQGRYYLTTSAVSAQGVETTLDFVNVLIGGGIQYVFDFANKARRTNASAEWGIREEEGGIKYYAVSPEYFNWEEDFEAGDEVMLQSYGGALGLPLKNAKVRVRVQESDVSDDDMTDELLEQVNVVPNPYYISHQGQKSAYDAKVYFTNLPKKCTIDIYTIAGDLIQTIEHDEYKDPSAGKHALDVWDLMSKNVQRVHSQTMIAVITSENGSQRNVPFSVVVGGFRIISD